MSVFRPTQTDSDQVEQTRERIKEACEVLKQHCPDSFAGRKTQEPFPQEDKDSRTDRWLNSKELQPPK